MLGANIRSVRVAPRTRRLVLAALAALCGAGAVFGFAGASGGQINIGGGPSQPGGATDATPPPAPDPEQVAHGRELFLEGCSSCHGRDARGIEGTAPSLRSAGAVAADFYLSTGRMPLDKPGDEPIRTQPRYPRDQIDAIVAYIGSFGGPPIPEVHPERGELNEGFELFNENCAGCHQAVAKGGVVTGAFAPDLGEASPTEVAEAMRIGPYVMPVFGHREIDRDELNSIARYVELTKAPVNEGGWGIGNLGPVPEGMIAWLLALASLLLVARVIGIRGKE
jgi:ubiquinol-cytochrome c reductase cytochrome c subunit